eukprot:JP435658.1.p1 GENE.JP435658.1~~JP435658.1.p1  ORF type:complete len:975 (+),score=191.81 JP435658.1:414-2927(+)
MHLTSITAQPPTGPHVLHQGHQLLRDGLLVSPNGIYQLRLQGDGNMVLRGDGAVMWTSQTSHTENGPYSLNMQDDGNLVLRGDSKAMWSTGTHSTAADQFALTDNGNLELSAGSHVIWSSNTGQGDRYQYAFSLSTRESSEGYFDVQLIGSNGMSEPVRVHTTVTSRVQHHTFHLRFSKHVGEITGLLVKTISNDRWIFEQATITPEIGNGQQTYLLSQRQVLVDCPDYCSVYMQAHRMSLGAPTEYEVELETTAVARQRFYIRIVGAVTSPYVQLPDEVHYNLGRHRFTVTTNGVGTVTAIILDTRSDGTWSFKHPSVRALTYSNVAEDNPTVLFSADQVDVACRPKSVDCSTVVEAPTAYVVTLTTTQVSSAAYSMQLTGSRATSGSLRIPPFVHKHEGDHKFTVYSTRLGDLSDVSFEYTSNEVFGFTNLKVTPSLLESPAVQFTTAETLLHCSSTSTSSCPSHQTPVNNVLPLTPPLNVPGDCEAVRSEGIYAIRKQCRANTCELADLSEQEIHNQYSPTNFCATMNPYDMFCLVQKMWGKFCREQVTKFVYCLTLECPEKFERFVELLVPNIGCYQQGSDWKDMRKYMNFNQKVRALSKKKSNNVKDLRRLLLPASQAAQTDETTVSLSLRQADSDSDSDGVASQNAAPFILSEQYDELLHEVDTADTPAKMVAAYSKIADFKLAQQQQAMEGMHVIEEDLIIEFEALDKIMEEQPVMASEISGLKSDLQAIAQQNSDEDANLLNVYSEAHLRVMETVQKEELLKKQSFNDEHEAALLRQEARFYLDDASFYKKKPFVWCRRTGQNIVSAARLDDSLDVDFIESVDYGKQAC